MTAGAIKKRIPRIATAAGVVAAVTAMQLGALAPGARAQSVGEHIADYVVVMRLQGDGTLLMTERISYDFGAASHHGIFRDLV